MAELLNEWLFTGIAASTVLLALFALDPAHPLAIAARTLGYGLASVCVFVGIMAVWLGRRQSRHSRW